MNHRQTVGKKSSEKLQKSHHEIIGLTECGKNKSVLYLLFFYGTVLRMYAQVDEMKEMILQQIVLLCSAHYLLISNLGLSLFRKP